jgi:hypothetical protein
VHRHALRLEHDRAVAREPRGDEVLDHLVLRIHGDRLAAGELGQVDPVAARREAQLDAVMDEPFAREALADADRRQQVDGALLEHAGAQRALDLVAAARLEHHRLDAGEVEQVGQQQARRAPRRRCRPASGRPPRRPQALRAIAARPAIASA